MRVAAIAPVLNEVEWIGYSIMAALPGVDSLHYGIDAKSSDGTFELVKMLSETTGKGKVFWYRDAVFNIDPMNQAQYNGAFNALIAAALSRKPDAVLFLHPDMIVRNPEAMLVMEEAIAWYTHITSYARDFKTVITKGRTDKWKNMHCPRFGLRYYGAYGSPNEDFYHRDITGRSYRHYGPEFSKYPYRVADSGLLIDHYCELKSYERRLEKMTLCLKTLYPTFSEERLGELARAHPRVTLEESSTQFGDFEFKETEAEIPDVFKKYKDEFSRFCKETVPV
jgi:hypothetical protein